MFFLASPSDKRRVHTCGPRDREQRGRDPGIKVDRETSMAKGRKITPSPMCIVKHVQVYCTFEKPCRERHYKVPGMYFLDRQEIDHTFLHNGMSVSVQVFSFQPSAVYSTAHAPGSQVLTGLRWGWLVVVVVVGVLPVINSLFSRLWLIQKIKEGPCYLPEIAAFIFPH